MKKKSDDGRASIKKDAEINQVHVTGWEAKLRQLENMEQDASYGAFYYGKNTKLREEGKDGQLGQYTHPRQLISDITNPHID